LTRPADIPAQIDALVVTILREGCEKICKTDIEKKNSARADHVIIGKPGEELTDRIVVSVHAQSPFGKSEDADVQVTGLIPGPYSGGPYEFPAETMGGMRVDKLIGTVQVNIREDIPVEEATWIHGALKQRISDVINRWPAFDGLADDMGNYLWKIETYRSFGYDSGGGGPSRTPDVTSVTFLLKHVPDTLKPGTTPSLTGNGLSS